MRAMAAASLTISIVTHAPDERLLARTLASAADAIARARTHATLGSTRVLLVDNGPEGLAPMLRTLAEAAFSRAEGVALEVITGHGNVGFGRGHNLAIAKASGDFHLILNPDVEMAPTAIDAALRYLDAHPGAGALVPAVRGPDGELQFLVKAFPTPGVLFIRGFVPRFLHGLFRKQLDAYEQRHVDWGREQSPVTLASGCFLFCRKSALDAVNGFDPGYFLYFEDFDLTLRLSKVTTVAYCPLVAIVHHGGGAASKGWRHVVLFVKSARRFFGAHRSTTAN